MPLSPNQRGAAFMAISQAAFTINDTLVKVTSMSLGIGQIMLVRGVFATVLVMLLAWKLKQLRPLSTLLHTAVLLRIAGELGGTVSYMIALSHLPISNVVAIFQSLPLAVTMGAAIFMGEKVGPRRWLAIAIGFVGVLIIVRPGAAGFSTFSLYVLISVACCAIRDLATRTVPPDIPSSLVSLSTAAAVAICGMVLVPFTGGWKAMTGDTFGMLLAAAIFVVVGYQFIIQSMRVGEVSFVAPFRYVALIWAMASGLVVFHYYPDTPTLIGSLIIVGSGIYTLYRERIAGRGLPAAESARTAIAPDGL